MLLDVFFHDAAGICAQIRERVRLLGFGRRREDAHARALTLAVGLVDDLTDVACERAQQRRVHGGRLYAAAAVKVGKDLGEDVFVHQDRDVAAVDMVRFCASVRS